MASLTGWFHLELSGRSLKLRFLRHLVQTITSHLMLFNLDINGGLMKGVTKASFRVAQMSVRMFVPFVSSKKQIHPACQPQQAHWRQRQQRQLFLNRVRQGVSAQSVILALVAALSSQSQSIPRATQRFLKLHQRTGPFHQASLNLLELVLCFHHKQVKEEQLQLLPPIAGETRTTGVFRQ